MISLFKSINIIGQYVMNAVYGFTPARASSCTSSDSPNNLTAVPQYSSYSETPTCPVPVIAAQSSTGSEYAAYWYYETIYTREAKETPAHSPSCSVSRFSWTVTSTAGNLYPARKETPKQAFRKEDYNCTYPKRFLRSAWGIRGPDLQ